MKSQKRFGEGFGSFIKESFEILIKYFVGRLKISIILGLISYIVLLLLDIRLKGLISVIVAIGNMVPYLGPIICMVVTALIVVFQDPLNVLWVTLMNFGLQLVDSWALSPMILGKSLGIHPIVVIVAVIVGGSLFNVWGIIFAIPVAAIISLLIKKIRSAVSKDKRVIKKDEIDKLK